MALKWSTDNRRWYLDDKPVHAGDAIEILDGSGRWARVLVEPRSHHLYVDISVDGLSSTTLVARVSVRGQTIIVSTVRWPKPVAPRSSG